MKHRDRGARHAHRWQKLASAVVGRSCADRAPLQGSGGWKRAAFPYCTGSDVPSNSFLIGGSGRWRADSMLRTWRRTERRAPTLPRPHVPTLVFSVLTHAYVSRISVTRYQGVSVSPPYWTVSTSNLVDYTCKTVFRTYVVHVKMYHGSAMPPCHFESVPGPCTTARRPTLPDSRSPTSPISRKRQSVPL